MSRSIEIGLVLLLFAIAVFIVFPITNKFVDCFAVASGKLQQSTESYKRNNPTKEIFCKDGQDIILSVGTCVQQVKNQNILAPILFRLVLLLPNAKSIAGVSNQHNQVCPQYPLPLNIFD